MKTKGIILFALLTLVLAQTGQGQIRERLNTEGTRIDTSMTHALGLRLKTLAFFHDNEFASQLIKGYTLPGVRFSPALTYNPISQIHLEVGASALIFDGANRYPNYAYHDIGTWKGNQYQSGFHVLPWVRAQVDFKHLSIIIGDIYGGTNHGLIEPLYNQETDLSQDEEMGFQLIWDRKHIHWDTWMNWQSYIFEEDSHQEAFTVGSTARILWNDPKKKLHWYSPVQLLIQHRGGEQDTTDLGVQTLCNGSIGGGLIYKPQRKVLTRVEGEVNAVGSFQENGEKWPFDLGFAMHAQAGVTLWDKLSMKAGYVGAPKQFISLYGTPLYSTISLKPDSYQRTYRGNHTAFAMVDYCQTLAKHYALGAQFQLFQSLGKDIKDTNFSFGIYLKVDPTIVLKRWGK